MTDPTPPRGSELVPDAWRELDDTLSEGPGPAAERSGHQCAAAAPGVAEGDRQSFLHGLMGAHTRDHLLLAGFEGVEAGSTHVS